MTAAYNPVPSYKALSPKPTKSVNDVPVVEAREGFPLSLHGNHWTSLLLTHLWMRAAGKSTPEIDQVVLEVVHPSLAPYLEEDGPRPEDLRTTRVRAHHIEPLVALMRYASGFPFTGATTLAKRANALEKINPNDLLADAAR